MKRNETNIRTATREDKEDIKGFGEDTINGESQAEGITGSAETDWRINYLNATCYAYATINEMDAALKGRHFEERKQIIADKCFDMIELLIDDLHGEFEWED